MIDFLIVLATLLVVGLMALIAWLVIQDAKSFARAEQDELDSQ
jgi:hypothetical protein